MMVIGEGSKNFVTSFKDDSLAMITITMLRGQNLTQPKINRIPDGGYVVQAGLVPGLSLLFIV